MADLESAPVAPRTNLGFSDLESDVCDLDMMAEIAEDLARDWLDSDLVEPLRKRQGELAVCMVAMVRQKMLKLKNK